MKGKCNFSPLLPSPQILLLLINLLAYLINNNFVPRVCVICFFMVFTLSKKLALASWNPLNHRTSS